jgi:Cys-tRNA(Pro)/Cys-tRNA(Cys) deacylase
LYETYEAIVQLLTARGIAFTIHEHIPSYTVADAQAYQLFPLERLLKTIAFRIRSGSYILAAVPGPDRIDYRKLAAACGTKRTDVFRLTPQEVANAFNVEIGSVSPILLKDGVRILFDTKVPADESVFCGIGRPDRTLEIQLADLVRITQGQIVPLTGDSQNGNQIQ